MVRDKMSTIRIRAVSLQSFVQFMECNFRGSVYNREESRAQILCTLLFTMATASENLKMGKARHELGPSHVTARYVFYRDTDQLQARHHVRYRPTFSI